MKKNISRTFQIVYEALCFFGCLSILPFLKEGIGRIISFLLVPFLLVYTSKDASAKKISFAIILTFLAYLTWTVAITFYLTDFLYQTFIKEDHSIWDIFALLLPILLTIWTLVWSIKKRKESQKYELAYIAAVIILTFILGN